ncbi:MAG: 4-phosphoerythronate dehydrogenase [Lentisphaeraceae bacterium]|nr:4-phosphoerythronate dehydrogenase [Lentisphaeraceae bacterium]
MKFVIDDKIPYIKDVLEQYGEVLYIPGKDIAPIHVNKADALIVRTRTKVNEALLKDSNIKFVATATIGFDHIDREYLKKRNITWTSCPGCNSESVAQYLSSVFVELSERHSIDLPGKTLGIIGCGNVGSKVKLKAEALGMKVLVCDPPRAEKEGPEGFSDLETLVVNSDFITLHVPLFREGDLKTFHLADAEFFKKMKDSAFVFNTSRGEVIDNSDLEKALKNKEIKGAVLDVWENEPDINLELLKLVDICTSHIAGYSADGKSNGTSMSVQALSKFFGLQHNDWFPDNVPMPEKVIEVSKTGFEGVKEAIRKTFDILTDDEPLRSNPDTFEFNRGNYQLRREFHNYTVKCTDEDTLAVLKNLGFKS